MKRFLIIADDFTGANDTGVQLSKRGISTKVFLKTLTNQTADSYVIDTESRNMPSETAYSHLEKIIAPIDFEPFDFVIKKVDSTLRGNILEELQAVDAAYQSELILFMPALPDLGRTTVDQIHYINGQRLLDTEIANDPVKPVTTDNIQTLLQNAFPDETVHALSLDAISADAEVFQNGRLWAVDAQTNHDMQTIIQLALQTQKKNLVGRFGGNRGQPHGT
ncbi:four-carbon acid sugar kinase family protein [Listeria grayi]|uniref:four-carbon acid sugar kinase family protein n=1 Tax=Listeria grayi TaxID=1641 RepID=UPI0004B0FEB1|nr:four-carbon acid sugar kinase family protein [Listeria grayi]